ncbi:MAG: GatB/YqeY domain-containing protein [Candidatus Omnitrophica bacterium]|nr:GatB/YqeY domain-containing protein [Candidatus Omnitrophota bacterium]
MLYERIETDMKTAMKEKKEAALRTIRMLKAAIKNREIEKKVKALSEDDLLEVIQKQVKQRKDSVQEYEKAGRPDLAGKESEEIGILGQYLPRPLSESDLEGLIQEAIQATGAKTKADIGKVMKAVMLKVRGRADGKQISQIASSLLP